MSNLDIEIATNIARHECGMPPKIADERGIPALYVRFLTNLTDRIEDVVTSPRAWITETEFKLFDQRIPRLDHFSRGLVWSNRRVARLVSDAWDACFPDDGTRDEAYVALWRVRHAFFQSLFDHPDSFNRAYTAGEFS